MGEHFVPDPNGRVRGITGPHRIKGIPYDNLGEACAMLGFDYNMIYNRMARDETLTAEDAMYNYESNQGGQAKPVEFNGKSYRSYTDLVADYDVKYPQWISRLNREKGFPLEMCMYIIKSGYKLGDFMYHEGQLYVSKQHLAESHGTTVNKVNSIMNYHGYDNFYDAFIHYITKTIPKPRD